MRLSRRCFACASTVRRAVHAYLAKKLLIATQTHRARRTLPSHHAQASARIQALNFMMHNLCIDLYRERQEMIIPLDFCGCWAEHVRAALTSAALEQCAGCMA